MAVDMRYVFDPRSKPLTILGSEYGELSHQAPMDAKLTDDGIATMNNFKPALRAARTLPRTKSEVLSVSTRVIRERNMTVA